MCCFSPTAIIFDPTTWYFNIATSSFFFSGFSKFAKVKFAKLESAKANTSYLVKAAFDGAKTVKGPTPLRAVSKSALVNASTSVLSSGVACITSTMFVSKPAPPAAQRGQ